MCMILIISTGVTVKNVTDFSPTFRALLFTFPHYYENSEIEVSLETDDGFNIFAMPACGRTDRVEDNS